MLCVCGSRANVADDTVSAPVTAQVPQPMSKVTPKQQHFGKPQLRIHLKEPEG